MEDIPHLDNKTSRPTTSSESGSELGSASDKDCIEGDHDYSKIVRRKAKGKGYIKVSTGVGRGRGRRRRKSFKGFKTINRNKRAKLWDSDYGFADAFCADRFDKRSTITTRNQGRRTVLYNDESDDDDGFLPAHEPLNLGMSRSGRVRRMTEKAKASHLMGWSH